ncbi:MAG: hypothetical protein WCF68_19170 [Terriglobales bacterium]
MGFPRFASVIVVALLLPSALMGATQTASCTFDTFSAPSGYSLSLINGVSDDGTIVGQLTNNNTQESVAFTRSAAGAFTEYAVPQSSSTWLYGRSGTGANAGFYQDKKNPQHIHGFVLQGSQFTAVNYPKATNTWLFDVNQLGASVGAFNTSPSLTKGFTLANGTYTPIAYPNAQVTYPLAINDHGVIVGYYATGFVNYGFLWQNGTFTNINFPKSKWGTVLVGINNSGVIVGNYLDGDSAFGVTYQNGVFEKIVYTGSKATAAGGINNNGLISGEIYFSGGKTLGFTATCK